MKRRLNELLDKLDWSLNMLNSFLITRDPSAAKSAEAFDGMRSKIEDLARSRDRFIMQLVHLHRIARSDGEATVTVRTLTEEVQSYIDQESVVVLDRWSQEQLGAFEVDGKGDGAVEVVTPAYVDALSGRVLKIGRAVRTDRVEQAQSEEEQAQSEGVEEQAS